MGLGNLLGVDPWDFEEWLDSMSDSCSCSSEDYEFLLAKARAFFFCKGYLAMALSLFNACDRAMVFEGLDHFRVASVMAIG